MSRYWYQGVPALGIPVAGINPGSMSYWYQGQPDNWIATGAVPPPPPSSRVLPKAYAVLLREEMEHQIWSRPRRFATPAVIIGGNWVQSTIEY